MIRSSVDSVTPRCVISWFNSLLLSVSSSTRKIMTITFCGISVITLVV